MIEQETQMIEKKLKSRDFVITAEIVPPLSGHRDDLLRKVAPLAGKIDALNLTDGAGARLAMSSLAASAIVAREGIEPIMQMTCRDRNRIGIAADVLGASALGVRNLLVLHGDAPSAGDMPEAKPVFDLDSRGVMEMIARFKQNKGPGERALVAPPDLFVGCADAPHDPAPDWKPEGLRGKIAAGAQFAQTQFCFDVDVARRYFERLDDEGITEKLRFIVGVGPLLSVNQAKFMNDNLFGVTVPQDIMARLENADDQRAEGRKICSEIVSGLRDIKGVSGVHIMAPMQNGQAIAKTIEEIKAAAF